MRILIIGKNSYIGTHIKKYLQKYNMLVDEFDVEHETLEKLELSHYQTIIHVAAIVHRKDIQDWNVYKKINVDLPIEVARLSKNSGVKQFIFLSSMAVYGVEKNLNKCCIINENTEYSPSTMYGKSKLDAEIGLLKMQDEKFAVSIVRPANVYGKDCRGNYIKMFCRITKIFPILPDVYRNIKQGFLYIDNLCELVRLLIKNVTTGVFPAQDKEMISSIELMEKISNVLKLKKSNSKIVGYIFYLFKIAPVVKLFGGVVYQEEYCKFSFGDYQIVSFDDGLKKTLENIDLT